MSVFSDFYGVTFLRCDICYKQTHIGNPLSKDWNLDKLKGWFPFNEDDHACPACVALTEE